MKRIYILFYCLFILGLATSCSEEDNYRTRMEKEREERSEYLAKNGFTSENLLEDGIYYKEIKAPTNPDAPKVEIGDEVAVYYTGYFLNGLVFENNVLKGKYEPMTVRIQHRLAGQIMDKGNVTGTIIQGWAIALLQMRAGTKARAVIPSNRAYGFLGTRVIPSNTTIVFDLEVVEVRKAAK